MKNCLLALGVALLAAAVAAGAPVSFDLGKEVDKDIVREAAPRGRASAFGENTPAVHCFAEEGYTDSKLVAKGLPKEREVGSNEAGLGLYSLQPYDRYNVIELGTIAGDKPERHVIDVPDGKYAKIGILAASVDGDVSFTLELRYADGTIEMLWWETDDWYDMGPRGNLKKVVRDMDRVVARTGAVEKTGHFNLYEYVIDTTRGLDAEKVLDSIAIGNSPNRWPDAEKRWAAVFAINGEKTE
jgi:hypothetical protein